MMVGSHVLDWLPEYALGSLDAEESHRVQEHLLGCHLCRQELDAFQTVADALSLAAPDASPSAALKPRLIERIQGLDGKRAPAPKRALRWSWGSAPLVAGLALILLLAVSNFVLWQRLNNLQTMTGPLGMRAVALQNTNAASDASAFVVISSDGEDGVLVVDNLPMLDAHYEYQVWLERDGAVVDAGVFAVDEGGYRGMRITAPESLLLYSSVSVTVEPAGGSDWPTGEQVLTGSLFNP